VGYGTVQLLGGYWCLTEHADSIFIVELCGLMNWLVIYMQITKKMAFVTDSVRHHEDGGSMFLQNICICPQNYSVPSRRSQSEESLL
jgi:hypothetical protein